MSNVALKDATECVRALLFGAWTLTLIILARLVPVWTFCSRDIPKVICTASLQD